MLDRRSRAWCAAALLGGVAAAGCAMQSPAPKAPESPAPPQQTAPASSPAEEKEAPAAPETERAAPAQAMPAIGGSTTGPAADKTMAFDDLLDQLTVAEGMALSAGHDCAGACRALKSMERAAGGICSLAPKTDSTGRCRSAEDRVRGAREKVRNACGQCADGTSVDPEAPVE